MHLERPSVEAKARSEMQMHDARWMMAAAAVVAVKREVMVESVKQHAAIGRGRKTNPRQKEPPAAKLRVHTDTGDRLAVASRAAPQLGRLSFCGGAGPDCGVTGTSTKSLQVPGRAARYLGSSGGSLIHGPAIDRGATTNHRPHLTGLGRHQLDASIAANEAVYYTKPSIERQQQRAPSQHQLQSQFLCIAQHMVADCLKSRAHIRIRPRLQARCCAYPRFSAVESR